MIFKNNKGNITNSVILWIFTVFFYFVIGYDIVNMIVGEVNTYSGLMGFFASIVPFIPVLGLMWWGYTIITPETQGGGFEQ